MSQIPPTPGPPPTLLAPAPPATTSLWEQHGKRGVIGLGILLLAVALIGFGSHLGHDDTAASATAMPTPSATADPTFGKASQSFEDYSAFAQQLDFADRAVGAEEFANFPTGLCDNSEGDDSQLLGTLAMISGGDTTKLMHDVEERGTMMWVRCPDALDAYEAALNAQSAGLGAQFASNLSLAAMAISIKAGS